MLDWIVKSKQNNNNNVEEMIFYVSNGWLRHLYKKIRGIAVLLIWLMIRESQKSEVPSKKRSLTSSLTITKMIISVVSVTVEIKCTCTSPVLYPSDFCDSFIIKLHTVYNIYIYIYIYIYILYLFILISLFITYTRNRF